MGKRQNGMQRMRDRILAEKEGVVIPFQVRWLANPHSIRERRQRGELSALSDVIELKGHPVAQRLVFEGINAAGVWYRVEPFTNVGPDSWCEDCWSWGHIESECRGIPACVYWSGPQRTSTDRCNVVGCSAKQGSLCGHTQEKRPNCKGKHIALSSRCAKRAEATSEAGDRRRRDSAGRTTQTTRPTSGANRTVLGLGVRAPEWGESGGSELDRADAEEGGVEAEDVTLAESMMPTTTATPAPSATGTATAAGTGIESDNGMGAATPNV